MLDIIVFINVARPTHDGVWAFQVANLLFNFSMRNWKDYIFIREMNIELPRYFTFFFIPTFFLASLLSCGAVL